MNTKRNTGVLILLASVSAIALLVPGLAHASHSPLPPRPTPPAPGPPPAEPKSASPGATIELRLQLEGVGSPWQKLWTVVQWQDHQGYWHTVEGWQGTLDKIWESLGIKSWWVAAYDLGTGPFRWTVRESAQGGLMGVSDAFDLPGSGGHLVVDLSLTP